MSNAFNKKVKLVVAVQGNGVSGLEIKSSREIWCSESNIYISTKVNAYSAGLTFEKKLVIWKNCYQGEQFAIYNDELCSIVKVGDTGNPLQLEIMLCKEGDTEWLQPN